MPCYFIVIPDGMFIYEKGRVFTQVSKAKEIHPKNDVRVNLTNLAHPPFFSDQAEEKVHQYHNARKQQ